jgi:hypothetical protein
MTFMTALLSVTLAAPVMTQEGPAPEDVKAGWLGLVVWLALALAVVFLAFSLRKHLKKVDFVEGPDGSDAGTDETNGSREPHGSAG